MGKKELSEKDQDLWGLILNTVATEKLQEVRSPIRYLGKYVAGRLRSTGCTRNRKEVKCAWSGWDLNGGRKEMREKKWKDWD